MKTDKRMYRLLLEEVDDVGNVLPATKKVWAYVRVPSPDISAEIKFEISGVVRSALEGAVAELVDYINQRGHISGRRPRRKPFRVP